MFFKLDKKLQNHIEGFSHLGETLRFDGEIDCKGEIEIAGKVKGNIKAKILRILETGSVKGQVQAEKIEILGHLVGNTESETIHVGENGVVRGDVHFFNNLSVLNGADIFGHIQKIKKDKVKRSDTDKVKYLEHDKKAS
jgi:cytoskeletal protein CcmA (bactofilin family)